MKNINETLKNINILKDEIINLNSLNDDQLNNALLSEMIILNSGINPSLININDRETWTQNLSEIIEHESVLNHNIYEIKKNKYNDEFDFYEDLKEFAFQIAKAFYYLNKDNENDFLKEHIKENLFDFYTIHIKHGHMQTIHYFYDFEEAHEYACNDEEDVFSRDLHEFCIEINDELFEIEKDHEVFELLTEYFWS